MSAYKECVNCNTILLLDDFYTFTNSKGNIQPSSYCKACHNEQTKKSHTTMDLPKGKNHTFLKNAKGRTYDIDDVDFYLYNDLPLDELMDKQKLPNRGHRVDAWGRKVNEKNGNKDL